MEIFFLSGLTMNKASFRMCRSRKSAKQRILPVRIKKGTKNYRDLLIDKFEEKMLAESLGGTMGMVKPFYSCT